jgi:hypothetical protein
MISRFRSKHAALERDILQVLHTYGFEEAMASGIRTQPPHPVTCTRVHLRPSAQNGAVMLLERSG